MNRAQHLRWAKDRAELGMMLMMGGHLSTPQQMREFIEGCN